MAGHGRRRRGGHHEEEHENEERWLVSFADMMTLLMCLFMVLFSISSVNTSKWEALQKALQEAFSGKILSGGQAAMQTGSDEKTEREAPEPPLPALTPLQAINSSGAHAKDKGAVAQDKAAAKEDEDFRRLKIKIDKLVREAGLKGNVKAEVRRRGLVVQLLTDRIFFDSGQADLKPQAHALLTKLGEVIAEEGRHPVVVEGHTDSQPMRGGRYPTNWELSGARAASVVRDFSRTGVGVHRLTLAGFAAQHPVADNSTPAGRSRNRRVEVVLSRLNEPSAPRTGP